MAKLSIIIPARHEVHLEKTVDDIFLKAAGDIEVIVILDGYWPDPILKDRPNLILMHHSKAQGLRGAVNAGAAIARGEYLMKVDAHCMFDTGFDEALKSHCEDNWLVVPTRYSLNIDANNVWSKGYGPLQYLYITFPYVHDKQFGEGMHGKKWVGEEGINPRNNPANYYWKERDRKDHMIDDIQTFQGSCWFTSKKHFENIGGMDERFGMLFMEAQEMGFKTFLSGGRLVINKYTWYAHWHKNSPSGFKFSNAKKRQTDKYATWYWMNDQWKPAIKKMEDFIAFHWPMPGWPENWREEKDRYERTHAHDYANWPEIWREDRE